MGCTDQHSSRMAVADIASRYLVPAIDCGGLIEGADGVVTGQLVQIVRFLAADPCPVCRGMISPLRVEQELLPIGARDRKCTRLHSSHYCANPMPSYAGKKKHT